MIMMMRTLHVIPFALAAALFACGATKSAYVPLESHQTALGLTVDREVTGEIDCHDGGIIRNDLPEETEARLEYVVFPKSRCVKIDLVDAQGNVVQNWSDVAWCNGRIRNVVVKGDGGKTFLRAIADSCGGTQLTLRLVAATPAN